MVFRRRKKSGEFETVIDLTGHTPALVWGLPSKCPQCRQPGYLDKIDLRSEIMFQHCPSCFAKWETTKAEVDAQTRA